MPIVGFIDDAGSRVSFGELRAGAGVFGLPRPLLRVLAAGYRSSDHYGAADVVSVTTLGNPVQQTRLLERHDVYVKPLDNLWAVFGSVAHGLFEAEVSELEIAERRLVIDFEGQLVGGTFDLLERDGDGWLGRDYKVMGTYPIAKMKAEGVWKAKPEYLLQANVYRYMLSRPDAREVVLRDGSNHAKSPDGAPVLEPFEHAGLEVTRWQLVTIGRDWTARENGSTLSPVELIDVPLIAPERVENYLRQRITLYQAAGLCDDAGLPACSRDETWNGRRCASYCAAASVCRQLAGKAKP